jgi:hypothetical protein
MRSCRFSRRDEDGFAMLMVIALAAVVTLLVAVALASSTGTIQSSQKHIQYADSLDAAEAGIDQTLGLLKGNQSYALGPDLPVACQTSGLTTDAPCRTDERTWATAQLVALAGNSANWNAVQQGAYVVYKPLHSRAVYSLGWTGSSYATAKRPRLLKAEYLFSTYAPADAILTGGTSNISGSFSVGVVAGSPPPFVHSNIDLTQCPNLSISAGGGTSSSGATNACGGVVNAPREDVPLIDPRAVYSSEAAKYPMSWFDLCPDGKVYRPSSAAGPCSGTGLGSASPLYYGASGSRGWTWSSGTWTDQAGANSTGIFYVYRANANMDMQHDVVNQTVITEATENRSVCPRTVNDGNIFLKQITVNNFMSGVVLLAGGDLDLNAQSSALTGLVAAQQNLSMHTSSAAGVTGAVIAENYCGGTNSFQGSTVLYDGNIDIPLGSTVRTSLELELNQ